MNLQALHTTDLSTDLPVAMPLLSDGTRLQLITIGLALLSVLLVAQCIEPDFRGFGTHEQLGLPQCTMISLMGCRCPFCGMTTSWAWFVRGDFVQSAAANTGGFVSAAVAVVTIVWSLSSAARGTWWITSPRSLVILSFGALLSATTLIDWLHTLWAAS